MNLGDVVSLAAIAVIVAGLVGVLFWWTRDAESAPTGMAPLYRELRALGLPAILAGPITVLLVLLELF